MSSNPVHGEVYSIQHCVIKFVNDLRQVGGFLRVLRFPPPIKWPPWYNWYIVERGFKHHKPTHSIIWGERWLFALLILMKLLTNKQTNKHTPTWYLRVSLHSFIISCCSVYYYYIINVITRNQFSVKKYDIIFFLLWISGWWFEKWGLYCILMNIENIDKLFRTFVWTYDNHRICVFFNVLNI